MKYYDEQERINRMSYSEMVEYRNADRRRFKEEELRCELRHEEEQLRRNSNYRNSYYNKRYY
jgi:hypothetical protein